jgi:hypothetical protein
MAAILEDEGGRLNVVEPIYVWYWATCEIRCFCPACPRIHLKHYIELPHYKMTVFFFASVTKFKLLV